MVRRSQRAWIRSLSVVLLVGVADQSWASHRDGVLTDRRVIEFSVDEGTSMSIDVSPDGKMIVFDLLGDIYTMSISGGRAKLLLGGPAWETTPRFSPDGQQILFASDRGGTSSLWITDSAGNSFRQLLDGGIDPVRSPLWSLDGKFVVAQRGYLDSRPIVVDISAGVATELPRAAVIGHDPFTRLMHGLPLDKNHILASQHTCGDNKSGPIFQLNIMSGERKAITSPPDGFSDYRAIVSRHGKVAYFRYRDGYPAELRMLDAAAKRDVLLMSVPNSDFSCREGFDDFRTPFAFTPLGDALILAINGKIYHVPIDGRTPHIIPFRVDVQQHVSPRVPPASVDLLQDKVLIRGIRAPIRTSDGQSTIFSAIGRLWRYTQLDPAPKRLTEATDKLEYGASLSPDGNWLAYVAFSSRLDNQDASKYAHRTPAAQLMVVCVAERCRSGPPRALTGTGHYGPPIWSTDSSLIFLPRRAVASSQKHATWELLAIDLTGRPNGFRRVLPDSHSLLSGNALHGRWRPTVSRDEAAIYYFEGSRHGREQNWSVRSISFDDALGEKTYLVISDSRWGAASKGEHVASFAAISPDTRFLAFSPGFAAPVFLIPIPKAGERRTILSLDDPRVKKVAEGPVTSLSWMSKNRLVISNGGELEEIDITDFNQYRRATIAFSLPRARGGAFAIVGSRLITVSERSERVIEHGTIVVQNGLITALGEQSEVTIPIGVPALDGSGLTIIPGLIDSHCHREIQQDPRPARDADDIAALAFGVTTRFDPVTKDPEADLEHSERQQTGGVGPRYFYTGSTTYSLLPLDADKAAIEKIVEQSARLGIHFIKDFAVSPRRQRRMWVEAARKFGVGITLHTDGLEASLSSILDGYSAWEHAKFPIPLSNDVIRFMGESRTVISPTLGLMTAHLPNFDGWSISYAETADDSELQRRFDEVADPRREAELIGRFVSLRMGRALSKDFRNSYVGKVAETINELARAGARIALDGHNPPGLRLHWAMWQMERAGMPVSSVLRAATLAGAEKLGLQHQLGSLEEGKIADFLILGSDPRTDIRNTSDIRFVVQGGVIRRGNSLEVVRPTSSLL